MLGLLRSRVKALFLVSMMVGLTAAVACSGSAGDAGPRGEAGAAGATGPAGAVGQAGPAGANGAAGANGSAGARGATGATGAAGANGGPGAPGAAGANGSNAALIIHDSNNNVASAIEFRTGGTEVVVMGAGFARGESVSITGRPSSIDRVLTSATVNDHGGFMATVDLNDFGFAVAEDSIFTISANGETTGRIHGVVLLVDKVIGN